MNYKIVIIGILLAGFGIIGASIYVGYSVRDVEVVDNAYETGLKYDEQCRREARLGWHVDVPRELRANTADLVVTVRDKQGKALTDAAVALDLSLLGKREQHSYTCSGGTDGRYAVRPAIGTGVWDAQVRVSRNNETVVFNDTITVVR